MDNDQRLEPERVARIQPGRTARGFAGGGGGAATRVAAALAILLIWAGSTVYDIVSATYDPPEGINTLALAAATYLFGSAFRKESK